MPGLLRLLAAALAADPISEERFTRQVLLDPNFRAQNALVAREGEQVVGFCLALARQVPLENAPPDEDRGYLTLLAVDPARQRQGIGTALLGAAEAGLRSEGRSRIMVAPYAPGYFIPGVDVEAYAGALQFFRHHGYEEVYRPLAMEASLWTWNPPAWLAEREAALAAAGVEVSPYRAGHTLPLLEFTQREFPGDWVRVVRETMGRILAGEPATRLFIAQQAGQVLGFSHFENERFGPIGVAAAERGRGLGHVLLYRTLAAIRERGFRRAWFLWSDDRTARRLYDAAGFREVRRFALLRKDLG